MTKGSSKLKTIDKMIADLKKQSNISETTRERFRLLKLRREEASKIGKSSKDLFEI